LAEPGGGPWANCAWVEVSRGRFVGGRIVKAPSERCHALETFLEIYHAVDASDVEMFGSSRSYNTSCGTDGLESAAVPYPCSWLLHAPHCKFLEERGGG
jgi:hypothetical protein